MFHYFDTGILSRAKIHSSTCSLIRAGLGAVSLCVFVSACVGSMCTGGSCSHRSEVFPEDVEDEAPDPARHPEESANPKQTLAGLQHGGCRRPAPGPVKELRSRSALFLPRRRLGLAGLSPGEQRLPPRWADRELPGARPGDSLPTRRRLLKTCLKPTTCWFFLFRR